MERPSAALRWYSFAPCTGVVTAGMVESKKNGSGMRNALVGIGLVFALAFLIVGDQLLLEFEFFYKSRVASELSATNLKIKPVSGLRMFLQPDDTTITPVTIGWGEWEPTETHWISRMLKKGDTFVDVGANVGYFTLIAASLVGNEGRVIAFEPDPVTFSYLEKNVRLNGLDNVTLVQKAASNESGTLQLFIAAENKGDHRIYQTDEGRTAIDVEAVSLDDYFDGDPRPLNVVKIDTQGAEGVILDGMGKTLDANSELILALEFWPGAFARMGYEAADIVKLLRSHDYHFFDMGPGPEWLPELGNRSDRDILNGLTVENDLFTNFLLIKGHREMSQLSRAVDASRGRLLADSPELSAAQSAWEAEARSGGTANLAPVVKAALTVPAPSRSDAQAQTLKNYFRSHSPLLAEQRDTLTRARAALDAKRANMLRAR